MYYSFFIPSSFLSSFQVFLLLLLLLLSRPPGLKGLKIILPKNYTALQGDFNVYLHYPEEAEKHKLFSYNPGVSPEKSKKEPHSETPIKSENSSKKNEKHSLALKLYSSHPDLLLKSLSVPIDGSKLQFAFHCGIIIHGGHHLVRLEKGKEILAESVALNVTWPKIVIRTPERLETYRSPADVTISFIRSKCRPLQQTSFLTWAELIYNNTASQKSGSSNNESSYSFPHNAFSPRTKKRIKKAYKMLPIQSGFSENTFHLEKFFEQMSGNFDENQPKLESSSMKKLPVKRYASVFRVPPSKSNLTSLGSSLVPSKVLLRPKSPKTRTKGIDHYVAQRVLVKDGLYSKSEHQIRFPCEVVGPAGVYSVRLISDVHSSILVAQSSDFSVEWAEEFKLEVPHSSITPCLRAIHVTFSAPVCVGPQEKIRLYARFRTNVTSTNPPIIERYLTERRAVNGLTVFDCSLFTDEPVEYCFVYVNTDSTDAVNNVRRQCVPTFEPFKMRRDGIWGPWSQWSLCTTTCGDGIRTRYRFCSSPSNGGNYCKGSTRDNQSCNNTACPPPPPTMTVPSSAIPPEGENSCTCGCHILLKRNSNLTIAATAADCTGSSRWVIESIPGTILSAKIMREALLPRFQWLKIRDGNHTSSPLLLTLPIPHLGHKPLDPNLMEDINIGEIFSSSRFLLLDFRSSVNESFSETLWGFKLQLKESALPPTKKRSLWPTINNHISKHLQAIHIAVMTMAATTLLAIAGYAAYFCRRYPIYKRSILVDDSPPDTPSGSPKPNRSKHQPKCTIPPAESVTTLTEVLSMKSLTFGSRKPSLKSYTRIATSGDINLDRGSSLPSSPILPKISGFPRIRKSSSQLLRRMQKSKNELLKKNRRSSSFDHLRLRPISTINEDVTFTNLVNDDMVSKRGDVSDSSLEKNSGKTLKDEEVSTKYKEYRKSLLSPDAESDVSRNSPEKSKLSKERLNFEKLRRHNHLFRSESQGTMKGSSSVSEFSEVDLEYDYYDYDVGNASAVPGSLFGMDPTIIPWGIDIDELDIKDPSELSMLNNIDNKLLGSKDICGRSQESLRSRPEEIQLEPLNIPPHNPLQQSITSNDFNDGFTGSDNASVTEFCSDNDLTPTVENSFFSSVNPLSSLVNNTDAKILNVNPNHDDILFADDSTDEEIQ